MEMFKLYFRECLELVELNFRLGNSGFIFY